MRAKTWNRAGTRRAQPHAPAEPCAGTKNPAAVHIFTTNPPNAMRWLTICVLLPLGEVEAQSFLDQTFADQGTFIYNVSEQSIDKFTDLLVQPDEKVVVSTGSRILRLNNDGSPDQSFGVQGECDIIMGMGTQLVSIAIGTDASLTLAGTATIGFVNYPCIVRLLPNGTQDPTFGNLGTVLFDTLEHVTVFTKVLVSSTGETFAFGTQFGNFENTAVMAKLHADGQPDQAFATTGVRVLDYLPELGALIDAVPSPTGGFMIGCRSGDGFFVSYIDSSGELVNSFNGNGLYQSEAYRRLTALAVGTDGVITIGGLTTDLWPNSIYCKRLNPNGTPLPAFGNNGTIIIGLGPNLHALSARPWLTQNGALLIGGIVGGGNGWTTPHPYYCGIDNSGALDNSVGIGGTMIDTLNWNNGEGTISMDATGRVYSWGGTAPNWDADAIVVAYRTYPTDIPDVSSGEETLTLYPNPVLSLLTIKWPYTSHAPRFTITDVVGQNVLLRTTYQQIDVSMLQPGTYMVHETNSHLRTRIIKL